MFFPDVLDQFFITQRMTTRHSFFHRQAMCCMSLPRGNRKLHLDLDFKDVFLPLISLSHFNYILLFF